MRQLLAASVLTATVGAWYAQSTDDVPDLTGYVLTPEWMPVSTGSVKVETVGSDRWASIDPSGRFHIDALRGPHEISVAVPDFMIERLRVWMPRSGPLALPPIRLTPDSYVRVRPLSPDGRPIVSPRFVYRSFDLGGRSIPERPVAAASGGVSPDGAAMVGPLPRGMTVIALDTAPFARTRLPDVRVTGESAVIDVGTVYVRDGSVLNVVVLDGSGLPVSRHDVYLDDGAALSPVEIPPERTDVAGLVSFERLAPRRYQLIARGAQPCRNGIPMIVRQVDVPRATPFTFVIGGRATLRVSSGGVAHAGAFVDLTWESRSAMPAWVRRPGPMAARQTRRITPFAQAGCSGITDAAGRVTLPNVPPGRARVALTIASSLWTAALEVPPGNREVVIRIPTGVLPLRVVDATSRAPIGGAEITWTSGGTRVEATTTATGDVLVEGIADRPGVVTIRAAGYQQAAVKLAAPQDVLQEIAVTPLELSELQIRAVGDAGELLERAVVEVTPHDRLQPVQVAGTDAEGIARFSDLAPGPVRVIARAAGFAAAVLDSVTPAMLAGAGATIRLSRGYRIVATVEGTVGRGPYAIRVLNGGGVSLDVLLDSASERALQRAGRVSLGPLPPGTYIIELRSAAGARRAAARIEDRDVRVAFR